jgi:hypothetical protein
MATASLRRDEFGMNRYRALAYCLRMIFSENRCTLFRIMREEEEALLPYLVAAIIIIGLPTLYVAVRYREYRKFLAGAFFVSSGMQFYFYLAKIPIPLLWTSAVQEPELSAVRSTSCCF